MTWTHSLRPGKVLSLTAAAGFVTIPTSYSFTKMIKLTSKIAIGAAVALAAATSAFATTQSTSPVDYASYGGWHNDLLSEITLPQDTGSISSITGSAFISDQGWGGEDAWDNRLYLSLDVNGTQVWSDYFGGGVHGGHEVNFDLSSDSAAQASLSSAIGGISWTTDPNVTLELRSSTLGYPGWELFASGAQFSATSALAVPEATNISMMLAGLGAISFLARRKKRA